MRAVEVTIPEEIGGVVDWFMGALWPLADEPRRESQGVYLHLGRPRKEKLDNMTQIEIRAVRVTTTPVPSSWAPEYVIESFKKERADLGTVMQFRFKAFRGRTRVRASYTEGLSPVQEVFDSFVEQVESRYPDVHPPWGDYIAQQMKRIDEELRTESRAAVAMDSGPGTAVDEADKTVARIPEHPERRQKKEAVRTMRNDGRTLEEIAEAVEVSPTTVKRWLKEMDYK